ncbi:MAG TPA: isoprenylcysteine carboxylmethyltransferase family protein, partial [Anaerolineae bacterium]|nr:isoprenylcysteine carboxylmethyltransferase family protein [Anaerolineae bacterium]
VILYSIATPFLPGSMLSVIPGILSAILFGVRTHLVDEMLIAELSGYPEFTQRTSFRLLPGAW